MNEVQTLLKEYAEKGSEAAFRELVGRYVNFVYSTALRLVEGDTHLAQDVTQAVFLHLSSNARKLENTRFLGGWLHRNTCNIASNTLRSERRRQTREREAALMDSTSSNSNLDDIAPVLDEAINLLGNQDRTAILLRFFEQCDYRSIAEATGSTEDAARMRINRALDKLRSILQRRGVTVTATALAAMLATQAVTAAPTGLALGVAAKVIATPAINSSLSLLNLITMTKAKAGIISALIVAGLAIPLTYQFRAANSLRDENVALKRRASDLSQLHTENQKLSNLLVRPTPPALPSNQLSELLRLRNEAGMQKDELARLRAKLANERNETAAQEEAAKSYFPKETWASAGHATPEAAVQSSMNFILAHRNLKSVLADMPPEKREAIQKYTAGKPESEIDAEIAEESDRVGKIDGIRIVNTETLTNGHVIVSYIAFRNHGTNDTWSRAEVVPTADGWR